RHRPIAAQSTLTHDGPPAIPHFKRIQTPSSALPSPNKGQRPRPTVLLPESFVRRLSMQQLRPQQLHPLVFLGLGMILALLIIPVGQSLNSLLSTTLDTFQYGQTRTYQTDVYVGHETGRTPSHFIALNLHGRIQVIEFPGGDSTHAKIYVGPQLYDADADTIPVTLQFIDTHHNHHPDMLVQFRNYQLLFRNVQGSFQPA
ncbi:MAG TPA: hypothetical protein VKX46_18095, partial [Ktedonobacteraceae bacterium]|nr:hypothetical protein [Ktedonobacteraceae bacterium]